MTRDAIVFACAQPAPEIWPWQAQDAGVCLSATGRSAFPSQISSSLCFPVSFRGTLDVRAPTISAETCLAAAQELARCAEDKGIPKDHIVPKMDEREILPRVAVAVAMRSLEQGAASTGRPLATACHGLSDHQGCL